MATGPVNEFDVDVATSVDDPCAMSLTPRDLDLPAGDNPFGAKPRVVRTPAPPVRASNVPAVALVKPPESQAHTRVATPAGLARACERLRSLRSYRGTDEDGETAAPTTIPARMATSASRPTEIDDGERTTRSEFAPVDMDYWEDSFEKIVSSHRPKSQDDARIRRLETKVEGVNDQLSSVNSSLARLLAMMQAKDRDTHPPPQRQSDLPRRDIPREITNVPDLRSEAATAEDDRRLSASVRRTHTRFASDVRDLNSDHGGSTDNSFVPRGETGALSPLTVEEIANSPPLSPPRVDPGPTTGATSRVPSDANALVLSTMVPACRSRVAESTPLVEYPAAEYGRPLFYYPRTSPMLNPFASFKYSGHGDQLHPMLFLQRFDETRAFEGISDRETLHFFGTSLTDSAQIWWSVGNFRTYLEARAAFKRKYWGTGAQLELQQKILLGQYEQRDVKSMADYVARFFQENNLLDNPVPEKEFVVAISGHFPRDVHREIRGFAIHDVESLIEALDELEVTLRREETRKQARGWLALPAPPPAAGATSRRTRNRAARSAKSNAPTEEHDVAATSAPVVPATRVPRVYQPKRAARSPSPRKTAVPVTEPTTEVGSEPKRANSATAADNAGRRGRERKRRGKKPATAPAANKQPVQRPRSKSRDRTPVARETSSEIKKKSDEQMALIAVQRFYPDQPDNNEDGYPDELVTHSFLAAVNKEGRPALPLNIVWGEHEWPTTALLDTGATISVISQQAYMEFTDFLKKRNDDKVPRKGFVPLIRIPKVDVAGPFGHKTALCGFKVDMDLRLRECDGKTVRVGQTFYMAKRLSRPMILGTDFMRDYLAVIAFDLNATKSMLALSFFGQAVTRVNRGPTLPPEVVIDYEVYKDEKKDRETFAPIVPEITGKPTNDVIEKAEEETRAPEKPIVNAVAALNADTRKTLKELLGKHARLLDGSLGRINGYKHKITMRNIKPRKPKNFPVAMKYRDEVKRQLVEMERMDVIKKDATEYVNPLVVVKKNNGKIRLCLDARAINETTTDDHAQPLTIEEVLARIGDRRIYSKIDINQAYWQIELEPQSRKYTGFMFEGQTYVFNRMPFGLKTAGASFTRALDLAVAKVPQLRPNLTVYLDDILLASDTYEQHFEQLALLFEALDRVGVRLNKDKCEFLANKVQFLGHDLSRTTVEMTAETKRAIAAFKRPRTKKDLQSFLGLVNWDRRFVPRLSDLTRTLEDMLLKNAKFHWTEERQASFDAIKNAFDEAETLFLLRNDLQYGLETDASLVGLGARLYQFEPERPEHQYTVAYASRSLKSAERNYTTTEQEGLALAWALNKFKLALMGRTVHVKTDHRALTFLQSCAMNSRRIARWIEFFGHFDLRIQHIPGRSNAVADLLSRNPAPSSTERPADIERAGETSSVQEELALMEIDPYDEIDPEQWIEWLRRSQREDATLVRSVAEYPNQYNRRDDLIRRKKEDGTTDRIVVPEAAAWELLDKVHRHLVHFGTDKVLDFASRYFAIDNMDRLVRDVVGSCEICLATKYYTRATVGAQYYDQPTETGQMVSVDLFGPLPKSRKGHKYVLVLLDMFSKHTALFPIKNQKVESIVQAIEQHYVPRRGYPPETILTDCGGQFVTARWKQFATRVGTALKRTAPYNPQSNPVERVMRELGRVLRAYAHHDHERWDVVVPRVEDVLNRTTHASTGHAPNALERDDRWIREAPRGDDRISPRTFPRAFLPKNLRTDRLVEYDETERAERVERASQKITKAARKRRTQADKREIAKPFVTGDYVWRKKSRRSDALHRKSRKLFPIYEGPLMIRECPHPNTYVLEWLDGRHAGVANSRVLRPHRESRLKEPSQTPDTSPSESPERDSSNRNGNVEEEESPVESEEYSSAESATEEEYEPEDLATLEQDQPRRDRSPASPTRQTVSQSGKRKRRRGRRRGGRGRTRYQDSAETYDHDEYEEDSTPEDDRRTVDNGKTDDRSRDADNERYTEELVAFGREYRRWIRADAQWRKQNPQYGNRRSEDRNDNDVVHPRTYDSSESSHTSETEESRRQNAKHLYEYRMRRDPTLNDEARGRATPYAYRGEDLSCRREQSRQTRASHVETSGGSYEPPRYYVREPEPAPPPPCRVSSSGGASDSVRAGTPNSEQVVTDKQQATHKKTRRSKKKKKKLRTLRTYSRVPTLDTVEEEEEETSTDGDDEEDAVPSSGENDISWPTPPKSGKIERIASNITGGQSMIEYLQSLHQDEQVLQDVIIPEESTTPRVENIASEVTGGLSMIDYLRSLHPEEQVLQDVVIPEQSTTPRVEHIASEVTGGLSMLDYLRSQHPEEQVLQEVASSDASAIEEISDGVYVELAAFEITNQRSSPTKRFVRKLSRHRRFSNLLKDKNILKPSTVFWWERNPDDKIRFFEKFGLKRAHRDSACEKTKQVARVTNSESEGSGGNADANLPSSHQSFAVNGRNDALENRPSVSTGEALNGENTTRPRDLTRTLVKFLEDNKNERIADKLVTQGENGVRTRIENDLGRRNTSLNDKQDSRKRVRFYEKGASLPSIPSNLLIKPERFIYNKLEKLSKMERQEGELTPEELIHVISQLQAQREEIDVQQTMALRRLAKQIDKLRGEIYDRKRALTLLNLLENHLRYLGIPTEQLTQREVDDSRTSQNVTWVTNTPAGNVRLRLPLEVNDNDAARIHQQGGPNLNLDPTTMHAGREGARSIEPGENDSNASFGNIASPNTSGINLRPVTPGISAETFVDATQQTTPVDEEEEPLPRGKVYAPALPVERPTVEVDRRTTQIAGAEEGSTPVRPAVTEEPSFPQPTAASPRDEPTQAPRSPTNIQRRTTSPCPPTGNKTPTREVTTPVATGQKSRSSAKSAVRREIPTRSSLEAPSTRKKVRRKRPKQIRPPRTTGSRRAQRFAADNDVLARQRDPATGKFVKLEKIKRDRRNKRKIRDTTSPSSETDSSDNEYQSSKSQDLKKIKSIRARDKRRRMSTKDDDAPSTPRATSTPIPTMQEAATPDQHPTQETRRRPSIREDVQLKATARIVLDRNLDEEPAKECHREEDPTQGAVPILSEPSRPLQTTSEDITGADPDRDPETSPGLSRSTPVDGGMRAPGGPVAGEHPGCASASMRSATPSEARNLMHELPLPSSRDESATQIRQLGELVTQATERIRNLRQQYNEEGKECASSPRLSAQPRD